MFQPGPVDLAAQFQGLHLKALPTDGQWAGPQAPSGPQAAGKEAGQALLKLLQTGRGAQHTAADQQPPQQPAGGPQAMPVPAAGLSLGSFLDGATPGLAPGHGAVELGGGAPGGGLFGPGGDGLPSLFSGNSIWSTSAGGGGGDGAAASLWGGPSIWSSQEQGWAPPAQPVQQQQQQHFLEEQQQRTQAQAPLAASAQGLGPHGGLSPQPLSPRHQPQQLYAHRPQQQQQQLGYNPLLHAPQPRPPQQPYQQQHGAFPPQQPPPPPPPPPAYQHGPPPFYAQHPQQQLAGLRFAGEHQHQHPYHAQPPPPFSAPPQGYPLDFPLGQPGGLLGAGGGGMGAGLRIPSPPDGPPPPPPGFAHAPKFAPPGQQGHPQHHAQQHLQEQQQQQQGLGLGLGPEGLEDRLNGLGHSPQMLPPPPPPQANGVAASRAPPHLHAPKVMRHQQLKQGPGYGGHFSPKQQSNRESSSRWVEVMDRAHTGRLPRGDMAQLDARLLALVETLSPTQEEQQRQRAAFDRVQEVLLRRWPHARVHLFGSVANGLSVRSNNDLDVCLEMEDVGDDQAAKGEVATELGEVLREAGMAEVLPLPKARVPVVKFVVPDTGTKVDVTVNNILACVNTKLLADYAAVDPRLSQLVAVVKHWAKQRAVNDSYRGTLSSYCYVLMCIHLLQTRSPPVLPSLQQMPPTFRRGVGQWKCEFFDQVETLRDFGCDNTESLAQLVWSFFEYWAWRHDYSADVVSVRTGGFLRKEDKDWTRRIGNERHLICIEDPFELSHDLGRTVDRQTKSVLHKEFIRAATLLRDAPDPMDKLFEPYRVGRA